LVSRSSALFNRLSATSCEASNTSGSLSFPGVRRSVCIRSSRETSFARGEVRFLGRGTCRDVPIGGNIVVWTGLREIPMEGLRVSGGGVIYCPLLGERKESECLRGSDSYVSCIPSATDPVALGSPVFKPFLSPPNSGGAQKSLIRFWTSFSVAQSVQSRRPRPPFRFSSMVDLDLMVFWCGTFWRLIAVVPSFFS
jgi:hypothetical protein